MRYKFSALNLVEELKAAVGVSPLTGGDLPVKVTDSGNEIIFDFEKDLTPTQEKALTDLMANKPLLRGRLSKFVEKGDDIVITPSKRAPV
jgi:hypothetical protein